MVLIVSVNKEKIQNKILAEKNVGPRPFSKELNASTANHCSKLNYNDSATRIIIFLILNSFTHKEL